MANNRQPRHLGSRKQRGAVLLFAAIGISLIIILLSITNIGFLYIYKREYQKAADLAAMAGASKLVAQNGTRSCSGNATPAAQTNANQNLGSKTHTTTVTCGKWNSTTTPHFDTTASSSAIDAVQVVISGTPPSFLPFVKALPLSATAIAVADQPVAALNIRSTIGTIDSSKSALLNSVVGGMLGGSLSLSVASWNGLLGSEVNLLDYLNALAVRLGVAAGNYDTVLNTQTNVGTLLGAAVDALGNNSTAGVALTGIIGGIGANVGSINTLTLGQVLSLATGTPQAGLDLGLNALDLAQAFVQLANSKSAVSASIPANLLGLASVQVTAKVTEPPQLSAVGNPALAAAAANPRTDANRIYVRTAQVRLLISVTVNSPLSNLVSGLSTAINNLLSPLIGVLNGLLSLDLAQALSCVIGTCTTLDIQLVPSPIRIDVNLDAGAGEAYVTGYSCTGDGSTKSLTVPAQTSAVNLRVGKMGTSNADAISKVFASTSAPTVSPVALVDFGTVTKSCLVFCTTGTRVPFGQGGIGLQTNTSVAASSNTLTYAAPAASSLPNIDEDPAYQTIYSQNIVNSLSSTLSGLGLQVYQPTAPVSTLGAVIAGVGTTVTSLVSLLQQALSSVLSPLLDPIVNSLLSLLGINLAQTDVGARLSCNGSGATLVD